MRPAIPIMLAAVLVAFVVPPVASQDRDVPYWATISAERVNMRVGPGPAYPVEWVYRRPGLPLRVVRVMQGWRLVRDPDGTQGWMVGRLLSRERGAIVTGEGLAAIRAEPTAGSPLRWRAQPGVIGKLGRCERGWCEIDIAGRSGWVQAARIWGEDAA